MNYIRYFLYGALVVACLMIWNTWQQEHQTVASTKSIAAASMPTPPAAARTQTSPAIQTTTQVVAKPQVSKKLITVRTDMLNVAIDPIGGNIVKVSLPQYPKELHSKDEFLLLNYDPQTLYTSQTGLLASGQTAIKLLKLAP